MRRLLSYVPFLAVVAALTVVALWAPANDVTGMTLVLLLVLGLLSTFPILIESP